MEANMKAGGLMIKDVEKEDAFIVMEKYMRGSGTLISLMDKEFIKH